MNLFNVMVKTDLCTSEAGYRLFGIAGYAINFIQIAVPILLIVMGTIDLVKALVAQKDDQMKKAQSTLIKRLIVGVVIFFVPMLVKFLMVMVNGNDANKNVCMDSFTNPGKAVETANNLKKSHSSGTGGNSGGTSPSATIVSKDDCESQGKKYITDQVEINMRGSNCVADETNMNDYIRETN